MRWSAGWRRWAVIVGAAACGAVLAARWVGGEEHRHPVRAFGFLADDLVAQAPAAAA